MVVLATRLYKFRVSFLRVFLLRVSFLRVSLLRVSFPRVSFLRVSFLRVSFLRVSLYTDVDRHLNALLLDVLVPLAPAHGCPVLRGAVEAAETRALQEAQARALGPDAVPVGAGPGSARLGANVLSQDILVHQGLDAGDRQGDERRADFRDFDDEQSEKGKVKSIGRLLLNSLVLVNGRAQPARASLTLEGNDKRDSTDGDADDAAHAVRTGSAWHSPLLTRCPARGCRPAGPFASAAYPGP